MVPEMTKNEAKEPIRPITVRIRFVKTGDLKYVSHLDLVRTMEKIVVRAKLPLWFTEGFNPKPKMTFTPPLSVGVESRTEILDLRLTQRMYPSLIMEALNRNMTEDLHVTEVYYPECKLTELAFLSYRIRIHTGGGDEALAERCREALQRDEIPVEKKGKAGLHTVNIRPSIASLSVAFENGDIVMHTVLRSDSVSFLNPDTLIRVLKSECGILSDPCLINEWYEIVREQAYREDMTIFR